MKVFSKKEMVIRRAWVTEKAADLGKQRKYVFIVADSANKPIVKVAVEKRYAVKVAAVRVLNHKGSVRRYGQHYRKEPSVKKAIVTLKEGHSIDIIPT